MSQKLTSRQMSSMLDKTKILDRNLLRILKIAQKISSQPAKIAWLRNEISIGSLSDPTFIMNKVKCRITDYSNKILAKDEQFFLTTNTYMEEKFDKDEEREFVIAFIRMIQKSFADASVENRTIVWNYLTELTNAVLEYRDIDPNDPFRLPK